MIRASAMFSAHVIHVVLRNTLLFFIVIILAFFLWLKVGIEVDKLVLGKFKVDGLYIKLDKKLTLRAQNVMIAKSKAKPSFKNVDKIFDKIKYLFTFFDYIELKKVKFEDNHLRIIFTEDILYVSSDDYEIAGNIHRVGKTLVAEVSMLHLKKEDVDITGRLVYNLITDTLTTKGNFDAYHIKGRFVINKKNNTIAFKVDSDEFTDLKTLINTFSLNETIKSWIVDRVQAHSYKLNTLEGKVKISKSRFQMDFDTLKGDILFKGVKIYYQKELDPILSESLHLTYKEKAFYFDLNKPEYKTRSMEGSKVAITGLGEVKTVLKLDLHMFTPIDKVMQEILKSYDLDIPVTYSGERTRVDLKMDIPLGKSSEKEKISVTVNIDLDEGVLVYKQIKLPVKRGNLHYDKALVTLENVHLKDKWYEGKVKGKINIIAKRADLKLDVKHISIGDKEKFFVLKKKLLPLTLNYSKNIEIELPSLALKFINKPKVFLIKVENIEKIKPYLNNIATDINAGTLEIRTKDFDVYSFKGELRKKACIFYEKDDVCHTRVPYSGKLTSKGLEFYAFDKRLYFSEAKSRIKLENINIDIGKFLSSGTQNKKAKGKKLVILGKNSNLRYRNHTLITDSYDIEVQKNGDIKAFGSLEGDIVKFSKKGKLFSMKALRIQDKMLHPLIGFNGLKKGRYTLKYNGNPDKVIKGQIIVEGGMMSDFKAYNNTLAFLNAIPALATLSRPGFSIKGFTINEGVVEYRMIGDKIFLDSVYIKGLSATIVGRGEIDIKNKTIDMDLAIQTARELGKFVGNLPLLGYILMGKDKSMTIGLKITGTLDKPKVKTSAVLEIFSLPIKLLQRTIKSPLHIINE